MGGSFAQSFARRPFSFLPPAAIGLLLLLPPPAAPCPPDSLRAVVVTIDGIRLTEFLTWSEGLVAWAANEGAYVPSVANLTRGITDPNHAILWGSGDPGQCLNKEGHPADPMHFELLRKERCLPYGTTAIVSGKQHLIDTNVQSRHVEYGWNYQACGLLVRSDPLPCMPLAGFYEGPDSLIARAALEYLDQHDVVWMGINLSEYDFLSHPIGMVCSDWDTVLYWARLEEVYREAERLVLEEIWPFLRSHPRYAGRTVLVVATDHGRHLDDVSSGFLNHGHGWLPDGSDCAPNCAGCRDGWAVFVGPGIVAGMVACGSYVLEDIPATIRSLMGFANPYETGSPIDEILSGVATAVGEPTLEIARTAAWVARPNPFRTSTSIEYRLARSDHVRFTVYDLNGREVWASEEESLPPGVHAARWDGIDRAGRPVADGVYLGLLRSPELLLRRKLFLVR